MEKECKTHGLTEHFSQIEKNKIRWRCKVCTAEGVSRHRKNKKEWCVEYLGGKCVKCGYSKYIGALEFHHKNPKEKEFEFSRYQKHSYEKLKNELGKCELLCANCHREVHAQVG